MNHLPLILAGLLSLAALFIGLREMVRRGA